MKHNDLRDIVAGKWGAAYDSSWDVTVYDDQGREMSLIIKKVDATVRSFQQTFDQWFAEEQSRVEKAKERKAIKEAKKAELKAYEENLKQEALRKLSPEERKVLGL